MIQHHGERTLNTSTRVKAGYIILQTFSQTKLLQAGSIDGVNSSICVIYGGMAIHSNATDCLAEFGHSVFHKLTSDRIFRWEWPLGSNLQGFDISRSYLTSIVRRRNVQLLPRCCGSRNSFTLRILAPSTTVIMPSLLLLITTTKS